MLIFFAGPCLLEGHPIHISTLLCLFLQTEGVLTVDNTLTIGMENIHLLELPR